MRFISVVLGVAFLIGTAQTTSIPGLEYVGRGVDVTTMALGLQQITHNTFNDWYWWTNPFTNVSYYVPEMMFAETMTHSVQDRQSANFASLSHYQAWAIHTKTWSSGFLGMDSHSKTTFQYLNQHFNHKRSLARTYKDILYYKLWAPIPIPQVTSEFQSLVNALPANFSDDSDYVKYKQFFRSVGSAIMTEGYFGGRMMADSWYETCLNSLYDKQWVTEQSGWSFCGIIGEHSGHHGGTHTVNETFSSCSTTTTNFLGGDSSGIVSPLEWELWAKTIMDRPVPVRYTLTPIHEAISWSADKAATVKGALARYMNESKNDQLVYEGKLREATKHVQPDASCCSVP